MGSTVLDVSDSIQGRKSRIEGGSLMQDSRRVLQKMEGAVAPGANGGTRQEGIVRSGRQD